MGNVSLSCFVCLLVLLFLHQTLGTGGNLWRCVTNPLQLDVSPDSFYCGGDTYNWLEVNDFLLPKAPQLQGAVCFVSLVREDMSLLFLVILVFVPCYAQWFLLA